MRYYLTVAFAAMFLSAACQAEDWSLSTWHQGPRSPAAYESSSVARAAPVRWRQVRQRRHHHAARHAYAPETLRHYRHADDRKHYHCEAKVRGLGTQWIGTEGALQAARKDWMERVRYDLGEAYLDMTHAADEVSRCGRVSIGETMGQVMYRCEIVARPCKGVFGETAAAK